MSDVSQEQSRSRPSIEQKMADISEQFMRLSAAMKAQGAAPDTQRMLEQLFKSWITTQQQFHQARQQEAAESSQLLQRIAHLQEEKQRLELLYTSGIQFSSPTEMKVLMGKALDTVIKALNADAGFIILVNEDQEIEQVVARNMDPDDHPDARDLSTSIIRETLRRAEPTRLADVRPLSDDSHGGSIVRLGISSVLCVPLISHERGIGAVYLDRRDGEAPFQDPDIFFLTAFAHQIVTGLEVSREISRLEHQLLEDLQTSMTDVRETFRCPKIVGNSQPLQEVLRMASRIAPTDASVIILGENGTGKELLARAIHRNSRRAEQPFVAINCSAIPEHLLESELFGYEAGAFSGARKTKRGKIEIAEGGTLFLDEIGELNINLQAKLLRVLQTGELERLGSITSRHIDLRVLAATNRNIGEMVTGGTFREDLYYRLKVIEITMPPLRDRIGDLPALCNAFLEKHGKAEQPFTISDAALDILGAYRWPGNIRELENVIIRGLVLARGTVIDSGDLPPELQSQDTIRVPVNARKSLTEAESEFRRQYIQRVLQQTGSRSEAARVLGVNRTYLYKLMAQLGIDES